tara:strand:- start:2065 stop:2271 length:207 start_codon:yes stop_codon:yes gene_type:complete
VIFAEFSAAARRIRVKCEVSFRAAEKEDFDFLKTDLLLPWVYDYRRLVHLREQTACSPQAFFSWNIDE